MKPKQVAIAIDQLINTLFNGYADETLSARAFRARDKYPLPYYLINYLFFWQEDHCQSAYLAEKKDMQLDPEYRK